MESNKIDGALNFAPENAKKNFGPGQPGTKTLLGIYCI